MKKRLFHEGILKETDSGMVLVGSRCAACGHIAFPRADLCPVCLCEQTEEIELGTEGTLYSYTVTRVSVGRFPVPHAIGMITLPEGVRLTAPLIPGAGDFRVGAAMKMEMAALWTEDDCEVVGYKFREIR